MARDIYYKDVKFSAYSLWHRALPEKLGFIDIFRKIYLLLIVLIMVFDEHSITKILLKWRATCVKCGDETACALLRVKKQHLEIKALD